ncbi:DJ-1/PfpI family protein [Nocardia sp. NPDC056611]|uniref:DJ-1/PfpI family protein n=1 Tax=Nocardia sp. NPDC056611 TaxID=3345877 RepID=UPI00366AC7BA
MTSVLIVVSAADYWTLNDETNHPTGFWAEELIEPHRLFTAAGWRVTIATPGGKAPTVDSLSLGLAGGLPHKTREYRRYLGEQSDEFSRPVALSDINEDEYDVVFYPGGHGPMQDLAVDPISGALLTRRLGSGKPLALLCHAPAAALAAQNPDGTWAFAGYRMTALSNREELLNSFSRKAPWLLEDRLAEEGADYVKGPVPLRPFIVVDRNLYTGQNPASSAKLARKLIADLGSPALSVSATRVVPASPAHVYAMIHDITRIGDFSPETTSARWIEQGRRFKGSNSIGRFYRWGMAATVIEATPGRVFAFRTDWPSSTTWRYELRRVDGGTEVTESMHKVDAQLAPIRWIQNAVGVRDRAAHLQSGVETTLDRLVSHFTEVDRLKKAAAPR